jgi:CSLREA domain-containing protein
MINANCLIKTVSRLSIPVAWLVILLLMVSALTVWSAPATPTATIVVDTASDELDGSPGNGDCSLREAIANANSDDGGQADCAAGTGADVITLPADTYTLTGSASEDGNTSGDLDIITGTLTINGAASGPTIIQAGTSSPVGGNICGDCVDRVLHVLSGATLEINDVTVRHGRAPDGPSGATGQPGQNGGGIHNEGTLTLNDCIVGWNRSGSGGDNSVAIGGIGGYGGGIYGDGVSATTLISVTVTHNETGPGGGSGATAINGSSGGHGGGVGIDNDSVMTLTNSVVISNTTGNGGRGPDAVDGDAVKGGPSGMGGGIWNNGALTLLESAVITNTTGTGGDGGDVTGGDGDGGVGGSSGKAAGIGCHGYPAVLMMVDSRVSGNETGPGGSGGAGSGSGSAGDEGGRGWGGGLSLRGGTYTLHRSTLSGNSGSVGGGFYAETGSVTMLIDSTISGNRADTSGGGMHGISSSTTTMINCTVSGNRADSNGGGLNLNSSATLRLTHVTVTDNTADDNSDGVGDGGRFHLLGSLTLTNTIVADNVDKGGENPDCDGVGSPTVTSRDYNVLGIGDSTGCPFVANTNDQVGTTASPVDPLLGTLGDWGGPTWTHSLDSSSPAAGQIPNGVNGCASGTTYDQRGVARLAPCDIGAFEYIEWVYLPLVLNNH